MEEKETVLKKNKEGYGYKYTELSEIHNYLEKNGMKYYQETETNPINGQDYILTYRYIDGKWEEKPKRGCKVVDATLSGIKNPAQEQGSALTYARRYSLLMAFTAFSFCFLYAAITLSWDCSSCLLLIVPSMIKHT